MNLFLFLLCIFVFFFQIKYTKKVYKELERMSVSLAVKSIDLSQVKFIYIAYLNTTDVIYGMICGHSARFAQVFRVQYVFCSARVPSDPNRY